MSKPILLINPGKDKPWASTHPPMNLGYIAANLEKNGLETYIIDELAGQDVEEAIKRYRPEIVGITATTPMAPDAYRICKIAHSYKCKTVMGGKHAMIMPREALKHADMVVIGEGEQAMVEIAKREKKGKIVKASYAFDLDDLPSPAWHLMDMDFYLSARDRILRTHLNFLPSHIRIGSLITIRGCPYACIFCYNSWRDTPVRFHSAERVVDDIKYLVKKYNIQALFFMDDDLFVFKKRLVKICELLRQKKIKIVWGCQSTADHLDEEVLRLAKSVGCKQVGFGFESGSPRILKLLKKGRQSVEGNVKAVEICKKVKVSSWATFMVGNPTETLEDIQKTFEFIKNHRPDGVGIHVTTPFPGTELWDWCRRHELIPKKVDWSIFNTGQVSIPANDTIPPQKIQELRDQIQYYFNPLSIKEIISLLPKRPDLLLKPFRNPTSILRALRDSLLGSQPNFVEETEISKK